MAATVYKTDSELLSARSLRKYGMRRGAYDGARKRRFVLFVEDGSIERRTEYDTKGERDAAALRMVRAASEKWVEI